MEVLDPNSMDSRWHGKMWESVITNKGATTKLARASLELGGQSNAWNYFLQTRQATPKHETHEPQIKGPNRSVGGQYPNSKSNGEICDPKLRGHTKTWESLTQTWGPNQRMRVLRGNSTGHTKAWQPSLRNGDTPKRGTPYSQPKGDAPKCGSP